MVIMKKSHLNLILTEIKARGKDVDIYVNGEWKPKPAEVNVGDKIEIKKEDNLNGLIISYIGM